MVYRTGFLLNTDGKDRYIQVETILAYYEQQYISTGKHMLYLNEEFIGNVTFGDDTYTYNGLQDFNTGDKKQISDFLSALVIPKQPELALAFGFGLQQDDALIFCEVILNAGLYEIWLNGTNVAVLSQDPKCNWFQVSGDSIQPSKLREITRRIEGYYNQF